MPLPPFVSFSHTSDVRDYGCLECGLEVKVSEQPLADLCSSKREGCIARLNLWTCADIAVFVLRSRLQS